MANPHSRAYIHFLFTKAPVHRPFFVADTVSAGRLSKFKYAVAGGWRDFCCLRAVDADFFFFSDLLVLIFIVSSSFDIAIVRTSTLADFPVATPAA